MSDPSAPSPELVHSLDIGEGDDAYRLVASFWRPPAAPEDTWRLEAFDPSTEGDETFYTLVPDLTMNIPAGVLDQAPAELATQAEHHHELAQPHLDAEARTLDMADMVKALLDKLTEVGRPEPSPSAEPVEVPVRRKPKGPRVKDPAAAVSNPGVPQSQMEQAQVAALEPTTSPSASAPGKAKGGRRSG